jgi:thiol-disulfide isomerase/thioredoxin
MNLRSIQRRPGAGLSGWPHLLLLAFVVALSACKQADVPVMQLAKGQPFPAVVLQASPHPDVRIDSLQGRMVVLNVWATWCPPCRKEMPDLERLSKILDPARFTVIGLSTDHDRWAAEVFLLQTGVTFKNYFDSDGTIARNLKFAVYPETFLIAPDGTLVMRIPGLREWDSPEVVAELEQAYRDWQAGPDARTSRSQ